MTPEQLRDWADMAESASTGQVDRVDIYRGYAAALEEIERLKVMAASAHIERDVHAAMIIRAERAEAALAECRSKLEVDPRTKYDGIDCRDETIRILDERLAEAERKCERLRFHAEAMARDLDDWSIYAGCPSNVAKAYRDEFKEE